MCAVSIGVRTEMPHQHGIYVTEAPKLEIVLYSPTLHGDLCSYRDTSHFQDLKAQYERDITRLWSLAVTYGYQDFESVKKDFWERLFVIEDDVRASNLTALKYREIAFSGFAKDFHCSIDILESDDLPQNQKVQLFQDLMYSLDKCMSGIQNAVLNIHRALQIDTGSHFNLEVFKEYKRHVMTVVAREHLLGFNDPQTVANLKRNQVHIEHGLINYYAREFGVDKFQNSDTKIGFKACYTEGFKRKVEAVLHPIQLTQYVSHRLELELMKVLSEYQALNTGFVCLSELTPSTQDKLTAELQVLDNDELNKLLVGSFCGEAVNSLTALNDTFIKLHIVNRVELLQRLTAIVHEDPNWQDSIYIHLDNFSESAVTQMEIVKTEPLSGELVKQVCSPLQLIAMDPTICTIADLMETDSLSCISVREIKFNLEVITACSLEKIKKEVVPLVTLSREPEIIFKYTPEGSFFWIVEDSTARPITMADVQHLHLSTLTDEAINHLFELAIASAQSFDEILNFLFLNQVPKQPNRLSCDFVIGKINQLVEQKSYIKKQVAISLQSYPCAVGFTIKFCAQFYPLLDHQEQSKTSMVIKLKAGLILSGSDIELVYRNLSELELLGYLNQVSFNQLINRTIITDDVAAFKQLKAFKRLYNCFVLEGIPQTKLAKEMDYKPNLLSTCFETNAIRLATYLFSIGEISVEDCFSPIIASPLFLAIILRNTPLILLVLNQKKVAANLYNSRNDTPLHYALKLYKECSKPPRLEVVIRCLIKHKKIDLFSMDSSKNQCVVLVRKHKAFRALAHDMIKKRTEEILLDVEVTDENGYIQIRRSA